MPFVAVLRRKKVLNLYVGAGGTCVIRGCVPKKLLVYGAMFNEEFNDAVGFGWAAQRPPHDWKCECRCSNHCLPVSSWCKAFIAAIGCTMRAATLRSVYLSPCICGVRPLPVQVTPA